MRRGISSQSPRATTQFGAVVVDTEVLGSPQKDTVYAIPLCAGSLSNVVSTGSPTLTAVRLNAEAAKFSRFRFRRLTVQYKAATSTYTSGSMAIGVQAEAYDDAINTGDEVMRLRPGSVGPVWKDASFSVDIGTACQKWFTTSGSKTSQDAVPFTLYVCSGAAAPGYLQLSYEVEFTSPKTA